MAKIDYEYETTEERIRTYLKVPEIDRLRWLEELCAFTVMAREAPTTYSGIPGDRQIGRSGGREVEIPEDREVGRS